MKKSMIVCAIASALYIGASAQVNNGYQTPGGTMQQNQPGTVPTIPQPGVTPNQPGTMPFNPQPGVPPTQPNAVPQPPIPGTLPQTQPGIVPRDPYRRDSGLAVPRINQLNPDSGRSTPVNTVPPR